MRRDPYRGYCLDSRYMACATGAFFIGKPGTYFRFDRLTSSSAQARLCGMPRSIA